MQFYALHFIVTTALSSPFYSQRSRCNSGADTTIDENCVTRRDITSCKLHLGVNQYQYNGSFQETFVWCKVSFATLKSISNLTISELFTYLLLYILIDFSCSLMHLSAF